MATGLADGADEPRPALMGLFVERAARGRGIGAALVEAVVGWARDRGAPRLYLGVTSPDSPAFRLYHRCGFRPTSRTHPLDHTPSVSVIEMVRAF
jgi:GNAT superfamily N-acetyltransferase